MKTKIFLALCLVCFMAKAQDRADQQHLSDPNSFSMILINLFMNSQPFGVPIT